MWKFGKETEGVVCSFSTIPIKNCAKTKVQTLMVVLALKEAFLRTYKSPPPMFSCDFCFVSSIKFGFISKLM